MSFDNNSIKLQSWNSAHERDEKYQHLGSLVNRFFNVLHDKLLPLQAVANPNPSIHAIRMLETSGF